MGNEIIDFTRKLKGKEIQSRAYIHTPASEAYQTDWANRLSDWPARGLRTWLRVIERCGNESKKDILQKKIIQRKREKNFN